MDILANGHSDITGCLPGHSKKRCCEKNLIKRELFYKSMFKYAGFPFNDH